MVPRYFFLFDDYVRCCTTESFSNVTRFFFFLGLCFPCIANCIVYFKFLFVSTTTFSLLTNEDPLPIVYLPRVRLKDPTTVQKIELEPPSVTLSGTCYSIHKC